MAHFYYRILINAGQSGGKVGIVECEMYNTAGQVISTGGVASASSVYTDSGGVVHNAALAFDGNFSTDWISSGIPSIANPEWLQYKFAVPVDVAAVRINCDSLGNSTSEAPSSLVIQCSDTGIAGTWVNVSSVFTPVWSGISNFGWQFCWTFPCNVTIPVSNGYFTNWRMLVTATQSGNGPSLSELVFQNVPGGSQLATPQSSYAFWGSQRAGGYDGTNLFDGDTSTGWHTDSINGNAFVGYAFKIPTFIADVVLKSGGSFNGSTNYLDAPSTVSIQGSNDGFTWTTVKVLNAATWTSNGQSQAFVVQSQGGVGNPNSARGNVRTTQLKGSDRTGPGPQVLTYNTTVPNASTDTGAVGQIAIDAAGNWYWCYATNSWARMGPGGYSNSF